MDSWPSLWRITYGGAPSRPGTSMISDVWSDGPPRALAHEAGHPFLFPRVVLPGASGMDGVRPSKARSHRLWRTLDKRSRCVFEVRVRATDAHLIHLTGRDLPSRVTRTRVQPAATSQCPFAACNDTQASGHPWAAAT
jgi:hypothetical protein